jgi:hypothetical protein
MNSLKSMFVVVAGFLLSALSAQAATVNPTYSTSGSNAEVFLTPTGAGSISYPSNSTYTLNEVLTFGDTSNGHYGQSYTYIPFTVAANAFITVTVNDLHLTDASAKALQWLSVGLFHYNPGTSFLACRPGGLCSLDAYDADPPTVSISSALLAGTQYLLRIGFGLCGCSGQYGGINLTVATTPIPPAMMLFVSALLGLGGVGWQRRRRVGGAQA